MRPTAVLPSALAGILVTLLATTGATPRGAAGGVGNLPPIVFVSRHAVPGDGRSIPGFGPHHRAVITGGKLLVRERDGRVRDLLPGQAFLDVSDPAVSPSARHIAFAGVTGADSAWRLWVVAPDGSGLRQITFDHGDPATPRPRHDDLDPCWVDDTTLVFASTRYAQRAQYADVPVTNLFRTCVPTAPGRACPPIRITAERNGAEEPVMDHSTGRLLFSRWWFNRHRAADVPGGITTKSAAAIAADTVNLWQVVEMPLSAPRPRLAAADLRSRRGSSGYQPAVLADGSIVAVYAANLGFSPRPGGTGIHTLPRTFGQGRRLAGAIVPDRAGDAYAGSDGLAPPAACAPAGLPDGRVLFSYAPGARGDFGLYLMDADGSRITRVFDHAGTLELDAAPIVARDAPPRTAPLAAEEYEDPEAFARRSKTGSREGTGTFRFHDLDVFAAGPAGAPGAGAAPRTPGARIRFFATLARPGHAGGDTAILVRESPVGPGGEVDERGLPAALPMFEQLVGPDGRVLMTAHGPAHVAGSNAGLAGLVSRCVGCHLGHSTLPVGTVASRGKTRGR